jgi:arginine-tRNA-protein transferase
MGIQSGMQDLPRARTHCATERHCPRGYVGIVRHERYVPADPVTPQVEQLLVDMNFERNGRDYYRPRCQGCDSCRNVRIPVQMLMSSRSMQRRLQRLTGWTTIWGMPGLAGERSDLLEHYIDRRFNRGPSIYPLRAFLGFGGNMHGIQELRTPEGRLAAMSAVARTADGLMSLYAAWNPELARFGLGHALTAGECAEAHRLGLRWLHLGSMVEGDVKMRYKVEYPGAEVLVAPGRWEPAHADAMLHDLGCPS